MNYLVQYRVKYAAFWSTYTVEYYPVSALSRMDQCRPLYPSLEWRISYMKSPVPSLSVCPFSQEGVR